MCVCIDFVGRCLLCWEGIIDNFVATAERSKSTAMELAAHERSLEVEPEATRDFVVQVCAPVFTFLDKVSPHIRKGATYKLAKQLHEAARKTFGLLKSMHAQADGDESWLDVALAPEEPLGHMCRSNIFSTDATMSSMQEWVGATVASGMAVKHHEALRATLRELFPDGGGMDVQHLEQAMSSIKKCSTVGPDHPFANEFVKTTQYAAKMAGSDPGDCEQILSLVNAMLTVIPADDTMNLLQQFASTVTAIASANMKFCEWVGLGDTTEERTAGDLGYAHVLALIQHHLVLSEMSDKAQKDGPLVWSEAMTKIFQSITTEKDEAIAEIKHSAGQSLSDKTKDLSMVSSRRVPALGKGVL